ncbi:glycosyltransferase family 39 protein [Pseudarthrobacter sp. AL07]|uniref:glycosyltransferase family 39 protein n=1 Tax=unclassified Pseudarthrobacter TaxID=2647000 RepID=UPI00249CC553|nr:MULTISPECIES: glycosyltransferase family 39 protein [unclassified Pseudarthrobacter]MDI3193764.1 glycosyltransferase family 39 protein [Pseudarthrobacter sp. AL20]MDI3207726.1 glycosyltransferase family 39 protein [Pseudarthrobacter sp. AL07]
MLWVLLALTGLLYLWGLDRNGWANSYYSAAAMAGSQDWTAFFFSSSDPGNAISVDKPPLSLWVMSASVGAFGLSPWSILVPQALMGVASVYLLYRMVRTYIGSAAGLLAATFFAVTPVAVVMFRYNNPDALLTLLMIGIAYAALESIRRNRVRWLILAGALTGAALLTKQLQIALVLPAVAAAYLMFAAAPLLKRVLHLATALVAAAITGGWWFVLVQLVPAANRPFVGGSRFNSAVELSLGYNGLDRLSGEDASRTMSPSTASLAEKLDPGFQRFLQPQFSGQFGWFLPLAVAGLCLAIWHITRQSGSRRYRAFLSLCSVWFLCSSTVLAFMSGIVHPYYSLTAVPPLSCLAATGLLHLYRLRHRRNIRGVLAGTLLATMVLAFVSASRSTADFPLGPLAALLVWSVAIAVLAVPPPFPALRNVPRGLLAVALMAGPFVWSVNTVLSPHEGAGVVAGPSILGLRTDHPDRQQMGSNVPPSFVAVMFGNLPESGIVSRLRSTPASSTWAAAMVGSETAANYQLASKRSVLPLGGFDGTDPFPTLEQFQRMVAGQQVASIVIQDLPPLTLEGRGESARIVEWVRDHYRAEQIGSAQYYSTLP